MNVAVRCYYCVVDVCRDISSALGSERQTTTAATPSPIDFFRFRCPP